MTEIARLKTDTVNGISRFIFRKFFQAYFESGLVLRCITNKEGQFELINSAWEKELGFPKIEMRKKKFIDFIHPEDVEATREDYQKILNGGETFCFINRYRTKEGKYIALEWTAKMHDNSDYVFADARVIRKCITDEFMPCMCGYNAREHCYRNPQNERLQRLMQSLD